MAGCEGDNFFSYIFLGVLFIEDILAVIITSIQELFPMSTISDETIEVGA